MTKVFYTTASVKEGANRTILRGIVQHDTLNEVNIRLSDGSKAFNYDGYTSIILKVLKADGTAYVDSEGENVIATAPEAGIVTVILKGQATAAAGLCQCVIEIYSGMEKMTSARLNYEVFSSLDTREEVESESQYPVFQRMLSSLKTMETSIEIAEAVRTAAETSRTARDAADAVCVNWSTLIEFKKGNKAVYKGSTYLCLKNCKSIEPTNAEYWFMVSQKGDNGKDGINGVVLSVDTNKYAFEIDSNGHLILVYEDGTTPPRMEIGEDGHLYVNVE